MVLNPNFKEFLQLLNAHKVRYLIIGGYAVARQARLPKHLNTSTPQHLNTSTLKHLTT